MADLSFNNLSEFMGPTTAGYNMQQSHNSAMDTEDVQRKFHLEQIAKSAQDRDIAMQKLPFELENLKEEAPYKRALAAEAAQRTATGHAKLKRDNMDSFIDNMFRFQSTGNALEDQAALEKLAKENDLDINHPAVRQVINSSGDPAKLGAYKKRLIESDPKWISERQKAEEEMKKVQEQSRSHITGAIISGAASNYNADVAAESRIISAESRQQASQRLATSDQQITRLNNIVNDTSKPMPERQQAAQERDALIQYRQNLATAVQFNKAADVAQLLGMPDPGAPKTSMPPGPTTPSVPGAQPSSAPAPAQSSSSRVTMPSGSQIARPNYAALAGGQYTAQGGPAPETSEGPQGEMEGLSPQEFVELRQLTSLPQEQLTPPMIKRVGELMMKMRGSAPATPPPLVQPPSVQGSMGEPNLQRRFAPQAAPARPAPVTAAPVPQMKQQTIVYNGLTLEVIGQNPDGSIRIRDPQTGKTGTIKQ